MDDHPLNCTSQPFNSRQNARKTQAERLDHSSSIQPFIGLVINRIHWNEYRTHAEIALRF